MEFCIRNLDREKRTELVCFPKPETSAGRFKDCVLVHLDAYMSLEDLAKASEQNICMWLLSVTCSQHCGWLQRVNLEKRDKERKRGKDTENREAGVRERQPAWWELFQTLPDSRAEEIEFTCWLTGKPLADHVEWGILPGLLENTIWHWSRSRGRDISGGLLCVAARSWKGQICGRYSVTNCKNKEINPANNSFSRKR